MNMAVPPWIIETCNEAVQMDPCLLEVIPDHLKTQEMCIEAVRMEPHSLAYVLIGLWHSNK